MQVSKQHGRVTMVSGAGSALEHILAQVGETDRVVSEIAVAAKQQAMALQAVSTSVNQMERMTQQNAAMVQQTAVAGNDLALQTEDLVAIVGHFRTRQVGAPKTDSLSDQRTLIRARG